MTEQAEMIQMNVATDMQKATEHLETELTKIRAGKASPSMLDDIRVEYYGSATPINQVANVASQDARTLSIQPYEKKMLQDIERAIMAANIGITPQNDGNTIRLFMPPLTEERRKEMVKKVFAEGEHAKISIRNIRRDAMEGLKKLQKDGMSEDAVKDYENSVQKETDGYISKIDALCQVKEKELLTV